MLRNYLKVAFRNINNNKLYSGLNILGLSVGLSSFFIIYLFIQNELAYDQFHEKKERIYRVVENIQTGDGFVKDAVITHALAPLATEQIPEIEAFSRLEMRERDVFVYDVKDSIDRVGAIIADKDFLEIFNIEPVGNTNFITIDAPVSLLISKSKAERYYGTTDVLNKTIKVGKDDLSIVGVFNDLPNTSSIKGDVVLLNREASTFRGNSNWRAMYGQSYFLLRADARPVEVGHKLNEIYFDNLKTSADSLNLQVLSNIHYSLDVDGPVTEKTDKQYIFIFTLVAAFILVCAVFNYIGLALSQSLERAKEIGVRKVIGAKRSSLYAQFITESILQVFVSFILALVLVEILIPQLELLVERDLAISIFDQPVLVIKGAMLSLLIGVVAAVYPAFLSTQMKVVSIFKRQSKSHSSKHVINAVTVFQIVVFIVLICVSVTTNRQMHFMRNENLGFDQEQQLVLEWVGNNTAEILKNDVLAVSGVVSASHARTVPTKWEGWTEFKGVSGRFHLFDIDEDYLETMGMSLLEGRNFRPEEMDSANVIMVNAAGARKISPEGSAIGKTLPFKSNGLYSKGDKRIIGVVSDFHYVSKKEIVEPVLFHPLKYYSLLVVKLSTKDVPKTVDQISAVYSKHNNGREVSYYFLDDEVDAQYKQENVMIQMINTFMVIAAVVAFIGLFGIAGYAAKRRIKEVGIRKVFGAGFMAIQTSLNRSNLGRVVLAVFIATPVVVYWMENWLNTFAYRIEVPYLLIMGAILLASFVMLMVASFHSVKVFLINPVEILKDE